MRWIYRVAVALALGANSPLVSGQVEGTGEPIVVMASDPYSVVGMDLVRHMSELLEFDAAHHEILFGLHNEMMLEEQRIEREHQKRARELFAKGTDQAGRALRRASFEGEQAAATMAKPFFADARLLVDEERIWIVDHIERRARVRYCQGFMESDFYDHHIPGLGAHPFDVLMDLERLEPEELRELLRKHEKMDQGLHRAVDEAFAAYVARWDITSKLGVDGLNAASDEELRGVRRAYAQYQSQTERVRKASMAMAEALNESLPDDHRAAFEAAWLKANYDEVQLIADDSEIDRIVADPELHEETRTEVKAIIDIFRPRLKNAARIAREVRYQTFTTATFEEHFSQKETNRSAYDDAIERIRQIGDSYASALRRMLTPEQRVKYGLATEGG